MPLSPLEAQACGIPVVVTDVGGSREAVCPDTGALVPAADAAALAAALGLALARDRPGDPRRFVLDHGDARAMVAAYGALYD
jgi:glycosyltransferase involved in cell wall biosynthesis